MTVALSTIHGKRRLWFEGKIIEGKQYEFPYRAVSQRNHIFLARLLNPPKVGIFRQALSRVNARATRNGQFLLTSLSHLTKRPLEY
jgi:hypothetical protein